jgi:hypothetical protein
MSEAADHTGPEFDGVRPIRSWKETGRRQEMTTSSESTFFVGKQGIIESRYKPDLPKWLLNKYRIPRPVRLEGCDGLFCRDLAERGLPDREIRKVFLAMICSLLLGIMIGLYIKF